jgi:small subunit ribosomal protein S1
MTRQVGEFFSGQVQAITDYGVFVNVGPGKPGLIRPCNFNGRKFQLDQDVDVEVIRVDPKNSDFLLALLPSPDDWRSIRLRYPIGEVFTGVVERTASIPVRDLRANLAWLLVRLEQGVVGHVHVSELTWTSKFSRDTYPIGADVRVKVLSFGRKPGSINLSVKQLLPNPWLYFSENQKGGSIVSGVVEAVTDYGVFVGMKSSPEQASENDIYGVVALPDVAWSRPAAAIRKFKVGDAVEAMVLSTDFEKQRISLGIKQLGRA